MSNNMVNAALRLIDKPVYACVRFMKRTEI